jgi:hypothetical protein
VAFDQKDMIIKSLEVVGREDGDAGVGFPRQGSEDAVRADGVLLLRNVGVCTLESLLRPGGCAGEELKSLLLRLH